MNLVIDAGNSRVKFGVFDADNLKEVIIEQDLNHDLLDQLYVKYQFDNCIISASRDLSDGDIGYLSEKHAVFLNEFTQLPITNLYRTPKTLGKDRLAGAIGARALFPFANNLIFDFGTALTINFINHKGEFLGGNIAPGLHMRLQALNSFTDQLPLVNTEGELSLYGMDTTSALRNGAIHGMLAEYKYYVENYKNAYSPLKVIITGGSAPFISHFLNDSYVLKPDLVLEGLNEILKLNV